MTSAKYQSAGEQTATTPSTTTNGPVAITAVSVVTLVEGPPQVLLSAVSNGQSGARLHSGMSYPDPLDPQTNSPAVVASMDGLDSEVSVRILDILDRCLGQLGDAIDAIDSAALGVTLKMPAQCQGEMIDKELIGDILWSYFPALQPRFLKIVSEEEPATAALRRLYGLLQTGIIESAIFCGVDSFIDAQYYDELASEGRLLTQALPLGLIPGEGGGAVLLQPVNRLQNADRKASEPLAILGNLGIEPEPHVGAADSKPMKGMVNAVRAATAQNQGLLDKMTCLLYAIPAETSAQIEWYQVNNQLWPQRLEESQRIAMMLGEEEAPQLDSSESSRLEYNLTSCLGETGAATLPILIALGCEQIRFDITYDRWGFDRHSHLLVCEFGDQPWRGALWLTPPDSINPT